MGFFKEIYCADCGKKTNILTRTKLADEQYLCYECTADIPSYIQKCLPSYSLEQYRELKKYIEYSNNELSKLFNENHDFYSLHIDTEHEIFYFDSGLFSEPLYLKFSNINDFDLVFSPDELKESMFGDKVTGKIFFKIKMNIPYFYYEKVLAKDVKAKAKTSFFGSKVEYENPKGMSEFLFYFLSAWRNATVINDEQEFSSSNSANPTNELQQAMALFMVDDLTKVTLEELKNHRNRLIKTFHPDIASETDTKYAQKINSAYEILKDYLS